MFEARVSGLAPVEIEEQVHGLAAERTAARCCSGGDRSGRVPGGDLDGQPVRGCRLVPMQEEFIEIADPHPGDHALPTHSADALLQVAEEGKLPLILWGEVGVTALGGIGSVVGAVPVETGLAQAGTGGDHTGVADGRFVRLATGV